MTHVEKDFWVTEVLRGIARCSADTGVSAVFKGGTSLSKAFGLIRRFSEDVDVIVIAPGHSTGQDDRCLKSFVAATEASTILRYQSRAIEAAQVIEELIGLAEEIREADARGEQLGLSDEELAFYDALETNDSAVKVLGDETLRAIACELVETVRNNVTIDWTMRENVRAKLRTMVRRILRRHGYPPDKQEKATKTVLEQAEALSSVWATAA